MRVAYTIEQCWHRVPGGTAVAAVEVAQELSSRPEVELVGIAGWHRHEPDRALRLPLAMRRWPLPRPLLYESWLRVPALRVGRADVVHATTVISPPTRAPLVVTAHDLAFLHEPEYFTARGVSIFRRSLDKIRRTADLVLCSSTVTMDDCERAGIDRARLRLVLLGVRPVAVDAARSLHVRRSLGLDRPYLLSVGTVEPRKNLRRLIQAYERVGAGRELVIVGPQGWGHQMESGSGARLLGRVPEPTLHALYAGADAFCYPSLREGFGLPVLEAMAHGIPVVTSRGTSTEEVAGGAAVLVDPLDVDDIAAGIIEALSRREELARAGLARAAELTWARTAEATLSAYKELVG